jgi:multidrug efflux pump subunit AcrA (membrane-fusion protein)
MNRLRIAPRALAAALAFCIALSGGKLLPSALAQEHDDHAATEVIVRQLEGDSAHRTVTAEALARTKGAFERAARLRGAGDEAHGKSADSLAREWAETARDLVRAADAETAAVDLRRKAVDAEEKLERTRALVEESIARVGRLTATLDKSERPSNPGKKAAPADHSIAGTPEKPQPPSPSSDKKP